MVTCTGEDQASLTAHMSHCIMNQLLLTYFKLRAHVLRTDVWLYCPVSLLPHYTNCPHILQPTHKPDVKNLS